MPCTQIMNSNTEPQKHHTHKTSWTTHRINMSLSWANSQWRLFSTSMNPHFVCRPRTFLPPTVTSRSLPITAKGMYCWERDGEREGEAEGKDHIKDVYDVRNEAYRIASAPHLNLSVRSSIFLILGPIGSRVDVYAVMTNVITNLGRNGKVAMQQQKYQGLTLCLKASLSSIVSVSALAITGTMLTQLCKRFMNSTSKGRRLKRIS